jgi:hypothetical protein
LSCGCHGSKIGGEGFCITNWKLFIGAMVTLVTAGFNKAKVLVWGRDDINLQGPFKVCGDTKYKIATNKEDKLKVTSQRCMEGDSVYGDLLNAADHGSHMFGKGGANIFVGSDAEDHYYFSMCSTKIYDGYVNTIENFGESDKVYIFCTKRKIQPQDISIGYDESNDFSFITVSNLVDDPGYTAIAVAGKIDMDDIVLNEKYIDNCPNM